MGVRARGRASGSGHLPRHVPLALLVAALGNAWAVEAAPVATAASGEPARASAGDAPEAAGDDAYRFDSRLLLGSPLRVTDIERFNKANTTEPGTYETDLYVNDVFFERRTIEFRKSANAQVQPCLSDTLLDAAGVLVGKGDDARGVRAAAEETGADSAQAPAAADTTADHTCVALSERVPGANASFDQARLRLNLTVPQARMKQVARGSVDFSQLDAGTTAAYFNYDTNAYTSSSYGIRSDSLYTGINAGLNVGLWRFHEQAAYTWSGSGGAHQSSWNNIRAYAERPLPQLNSQITLGQSFTGGNLLSSVGYTGVHLETDDRMLPESMRGYAPVVNGVARTNARVIVSQNGNIIYQTSVAPGPFAIRDLNPTSYQGDLSVQVVEADGQVSTFSVPFSALPNSLRPGVSHYSFTAGQVRQVEGSSAKFVDLTYERGLTNLVTANGGLRVSDRYQSVLGGVVLGTRAGAFGANLAWSNARDANGQPVNGWRSSLNYSHTIQQTGTTLALAGYRYSTRGYRDFLDSIGSQAAAERGDAWSSTTYQQRDQATVNINQTLGDYGALSLSGALTSYYGGRPRDTQFQFSYNNHYRAISYNLSFIRQKSSALYSTGMPNLVAGNSPTVTSADSSNLYMLTVSIPLGNSASVSGSVASGTRQGTSLQASVSGTVDDAKTLSYGLSASAQTDNAARTASANLQKNFSSVTAGGSYSQGNGFWQAGVNARGAAVLHPGGLTLGPYVSDTFGVVEAKGAEGAQVRNGLGAKIDRWGFAIVPWLTPYQYNDVALDAKGINQNAELTTNQLRVAPYAGSIVRLRFDTRTGHALLIEATQADGTPLPLGANVLDGDAHGAVIGVVGQGGLVYARVPKEEGTVTIKWSDDEGGTCSLPYRVAKEDRQAPLIRVEGARCVAPASSLQALNDAGGSGSH
ncbi:fimbria/pilus outer membrane usher protein [Burkholderia sp. SRS-W-2-2016]|uniref:fimbria/pilus outer membrane usher protein n=1 Tax=Burkholderia sp. SRS-W-2-2016 TaxID=1926878 RepID=UPI0009FB3D01|nr:fimbria/pilus outer membrane usher protein [Burkholderia sp. SRS-W-2-2016]